MAGKFDRSNILKIRGAALLSILTFTGCLISVWLHCLPALSADHKSLKPTPNSGAVIINGKILFVIHSNLGPFSPETRAANVITRLKKLIADPDIQPDSILLSENTNSTEIIAGDVIIASVTDDDAKAVSTNRQVLAKELATALKTTIEENKAQQRLNSAFEKAIPSNFGRSLINLATNPMSLKLLTVVTGSVIISMVCMLFNQSLSSLVKESSRRYASRKIVSITGYLLTFILTIVVFKDALGNLALIVGAATAGVAFALKDVIASLAGWAAVTFGDYYKVGDRIQVGGIKGDVIDVGIARTTLMELGEWVLGDLYTGRIVKVSNSFIFKEPMFNYSGDFPYLWDEITIPVKYGTDYMLADQLLKAVVTDVTAKDVPDAREHWSRIEQKFLVEAARIEPMVTMALNDNWIEFTIRYSVQFRMRRITKDQLFRRIMHEFTQTDGRVELASATFQLTEAPTFNVRIKQPVQTTSEEPPKACNAA